MQTLFAVDDLVMNLTKERERERERERGEMARGLYYKTSDLSILHHCCIRLVCLSSSSTFSLALPWSLSRKHQTRVEVSNTA
jgi:hypothetical protein